MNSKILYPRDVDAKKFIDTKGYYDMDTIKFPIRFSRNVSDKTFGVVFISSTELVVLPFGPMPKDAAGFLYTNFLEITETLEKEIQNMESPLLLYNKVYFAKFTDPKTVTISPASAFCYAITADCFVDDIVFTDNDGKLFRFVGEQEDRYQISAVNLAHRYLRAPSPTTTDMSDDSKRVLLYLVQELFGTGKKKLIEEYREDRIFKVMRTSKEQFLGIPEKYTDKLSKLTASVIKESIEKESEPTEPEDDYIGVSYIRLIDFFLGDDTLLELSSNNKLRIEFILDKDEKLCKDFQQVYYDKELYIRPNKDVKLNPNEIKHSFSVLKYTELPYLEKEMKPLFNDVIKDDEIDEIDDNDLIAGWREL